MRAASDVRTNFWLRDDNSRVPLQLAPCDRLPSHVKRLPYTALQAFPAGLDRGWGLRSVQPVARGQIVGEMVGRLLSEEELTLLEDRRYVMSFDDDTLELKRTYDDAVRYIDCREYGNMIRLMNDCEQASNCEVLYWPPVDVASNTFPRHVFLLAKEDVPPLCELTWDCIRPFSNHGCRVPF